MRITVLSALVIVACVTAIADAQRTTVNTTSGDVALKIALNRELIDGDLAASTRRYRDIVTEYHTTNPGVAATALARMARSFEKLGPAGAADARATYAEIVRDFADQPEALIARTRLGGDAAQGTATRGDRPVWTGDDVDLFGTVSPDGRFLTYVDWRGAANLMVRDLFANTSRPLTGNTTTNRSVVADFSAISRDGSQVAYWWGSGELRVSSLTGTGVPTHRVVRTGAYIRPFDWSPDNSSIAALVDERQIVVVTVSDGKLRQLKSVGWQGVGKMVFSPDGRHIAYDLAGAEQQGSRDIMVIAADGSSEVPIVVDAFRNYVMGWSSTGDLVFSSDRSGTRSLWTVRVENGRPQGKPRLGKENVRSTWSLGLTPSGTLYVYQPASPSYVGVSAFDSAQAGGLDLGPDAFQRYIESRGHPRWSADGQHMAFISCGLSGGGPCSLFVRDGSAEPREVLHGMWYMGAPNLSPDGTAVVTQGNDRNDRGGIYVIDTRSGHTSRLVEPGTRPRNPQWSSDGRAIRYVENRGQEVVIVERDIAGDRSKEIFRTTEPNGSSWMVSPDGKQIAFIQRSPGDFQTMPGTLVVMPLTGGARTVFTSAAIDRPEWAPDGQSLIVQKFLTSGVEIWRVPLNGQAVKLPIAPANARANADLQVSPDGKRLAFVAQAGAPGNQVVAIENFLP